MYCSWHVREVQPKDQLQFSQVALQRQDRAGPTPRNVALAPKAIFLSSQSQVINLKCCFYQLIYSIMVIKYD